MWGYRRPPQAGRNEAFGRPAEEAEGRGSSGIARRGVEAKVVRASHDQRRHFERDADKNGGERFRRRATARRGLVNPHFYRSWDPLIETALYRVKRERSM